jgi:adenosylcobinamide-phosphate synthase
MLISSSGLFIVIAALAFDALIGDPEWLWRRWGHPVTQIGTLIDALDRGLNRKHLSPQQRKTAGIVSTAILVVIAAAVGAVVQAIVQQFPAGNILLALIASIFIAQRSLYRYVAWVRSAFAKGGLAGARKAVAMIVGRDPEQLDEAGVCRAAIESCAENFSDGVVAPVFWLALLGLPGLIAYKAINTADSMIGHRTEQYESFGWAAARLDDLVNLVPARLSALLLAVAAPIAGGSIATSWGIVRRDASHHRSPNAGWPESAMAGALGLALAGPRHYAEHTVDDPFLNAEATSQAVPEDIGRALDLYIAACVIEAAVYTALALVVYAALALVV